MKLAIETMT